MINYKSFMKLLLLMTNEVEDDLIIIAICKILNFTDC